MNVRVIKTFCDLVRTGSFSRAAKLNNVSQSAVSQQVASLEGELSTQLLCRGGGPTVPTDAGQAFFRGAREILRRYDRMMAEMRTADAARRGELRLGTIYSVGFYLLDPVIRAYLRDFSQVSLHVEYARWNDITEAILRGRLDLGVVAYPQRRRGVRILPITDEPLAVACSPDHEFAGQDSIDPRDLDGKPLVAFEPQVPTRRAIDKLLRRHKCRPKIAMEFDNIETLKRALEVNAGAGIVPENTVADEVREGYLVRIPFADPDPWTRKIAILRPRGKAPSEAERTFLRLLGVTAE